MGALLATNAEEDLPFKHTQQWASNEEWLSACYVTLWTSNDAGKIV